MERKFCQYMIWVILLLGQLHGYKSCVEKERKALFELKKYIISIAEEEYSDYVLSTWTNDTKSNCCHWEGLKCSHASGRVTEIAFDGLYFKEKSLLNLSLLHPFEDVRCLNLSGYSQFNGLFDDVEGYKSLGKLRNLEILDFSHNDFNSSIFPFLNSATSLTTLFLRDNYMNGPLPTKELSALRKLKSLVLSNNQFSAPVGSQGYKSLRSLRNLENLDLSKNAMNNSIFPFLSVVTSLKTLFLRSNIMNCPFPAEELKDLKNLELLDLSENYIDGFKPTQDLSALRKLKALDLSDNIFSGSMELLGICKMKNMQELDLSKNEFVGQFPECLTRLTGLRVLDLSSNQLTGNVPSALGNLGSLEYLSLYDNNFEGLFSLGFLANLSELRVFKLGSMSKSFQVESKSSWKPKFQLSFIALPSCNLVKVPHFLLYQKDLRRVDLSDNKITGIFPSWLLANNTKLGSLFLQNNSLASFQLPKSPHGLRSLDVSVNEFNQLLPENIGWILPHLQHMNLANNNFQGNLPSSLGNMERIAYLNISHNSFHGKLPRSVIMGCYSMIILTLSHNKLSGEILPRSTNFSAIWELYMDNNLFTGEIGQGFRSLRYLELLDISNNNLRGVIPSWIGELSFLRAVLLSNNMLEGEIPISLFNLTELQLLDLSANILSGAIPPHVTSTGPVVLLLQDNHLSREIPDTLLTNVSVLDLRNNRLSGNIPEFTNTRNTHTILLQGNNLTGSIPRQLCGLRNIQHLDLANNRLNGSIPSCLSNTSFVLGKEDTFYDYRSIFVLFNDILAQEDSGVEELYKSLIVLDPFRLVAWINIQIKFEFATKHRYDVYAGGILNLLFGMDLSKNELSGDIPAELGGLVELRTLNLSHNKLSGVIPESFLGLKNVESLDLSFNRLHGEIPPQLTELSSLQVFNVSFNNLSGAIPQGRHSTTFGTQSFLGNPLLYGQPTTRSCVKSNFQEPENEVKDDESQIDMVSFYWSLAAAYVTILVGLFASLSFDSPWSRFWFYLVDVFIHKAGNLFW